MRELAASPLEYAVTQKCARNSFVMRTCKIIGLKVPWNEQLQKIPGGGTSEVEKVGEFGEKLVAQVARHRGRAALVVVADDERGTRGEVGWPEWSSR